MICFIWIKENAMEVMKIMNRQRITFYNSIKSVDNPVFDKKPIANLILQ